MNLTFLFITGITAIAVCSPNSARSGDVGPVRHWDFEQEDPQGWTLITKEPSAVAHGVLQLTPPKVPTRHPFSTAAVAQSPSGLGIPAERITQVRLRARNASPLTDYYVRWKTQEHLWGFESLDEKARMFAPQPQTRRCAIEPDTQKWQELTCYIDQRWQGTIDQIELIAPLQKGELQIEWIELAAGTAQVLPPHPDIASDRVIPLLSVPGLSREGFAAAFKTLEDSVVLDLPLQGFRYPTLHPGGHWYNLGWTQFDTPVDASGAQWTAPSFVEGILRGFYEIQSATTDGHIAGLGAAPRKATSNMSSLPVYFEVAYDVARRTGDAALREQIYESMRRYLDWWLSPAKRHEKTGLISGFWEETFGEIGQAPHISGESYSAGEAMTVAPVDLNVLVAVGAARTAALATSLGKTADAARYRQVFTELSRAINTDLWDESSGVYRNHDLRTGQAIPGLNVSIFDPLRMEIAPKLRRKLLLQRLIDPKQFNWGRHPLTSWSMIDPGFLEADIDTGPGAHWGDVWSFHNMNIVRGLEESGRPDLAAELNWATINEFHDNYAEFILPSSGKGRGSHGYGMTAAHYISAVIEHLFGVDYDRLQNRITIAPYVPEALFGKPIALESLHLPAQGDTRLSVFITQRSAREAKITLRIKGPLPQGSLRVTLPGSGEPVDLPMQSAVTVNFPVQK